MATKEKSECDRESLLVKDASERLPGAAEQDHADVTVHQKISGKAWGVLQFRKLRLFPISIFFIVGNEFCERFSYYGMRAILALFLHDKLGFSENNSTSIYHTFVMLSFFLPILGAIISDSWLGKYWTIMSLSVVHAAGNVLVAIGAIPFTRELNIALVMIGLFTLALGTGGIKPCISAFGGDQFQKDQTDLLRRFFSLFYFSINAGSTISTLITPVLRSQVHCFGEEQCFSLAFSVPAVLMLVSIIVFAIGTRLYVRNKPKKEAALLFFHVPWCALVAVCRRIRYGKIADKKNILQYAVPKYTEKFAQDVWLVVRVAVMVTPMLGFWALMDQTGSRWTFQATRMNGRLGKLTILPDQMQSLNPIFILLFIPFFEAIFYPIFAKCHLFKKPLQRMTGGLSATALAYIVAGFVELKVQSADSLLGFGEGKVVFTNALQERIQLNLEIGNASNVFYLEHGESYQYLSNNLGSWTTEVVNNSDEAVSYSFDVELANQVITHAIISVDEGGLTSKTYGYEEFIPQGGKAGVQVISAIDSGGDLFNFSLCTTASCEQTIFDAPDLEFLSPTNFTDISIGSYYYYIRNNTESDHHSAWGSQLGMRLDVGAIYTLVLSSSYENATETFSVAIVEVDPPNSVSLFLQVPMYALITVGEVMASISSIEFSYSQAPPSMKSMCQAINMMAVAIGNLIVIIVAESSPFNNQAIEFFFFAGLMAAITLVFVVMAYFYKYVDPSLYTSIKSDSDVNETTSLMDDLDEQEDTNTSTAVEKVDLDLSKSTESAV